jgi:hypothetical protein
LLAIFTIMKIKNYLLVWAFVLTNINSIGQTFVLDSLFGENGNSALVGSTNDTYTTKKIIKNNQNEVFVAGTFGFFLLVIITGILF